MNLFLNTVVNIETSHHTIETLENTAKALNVSIDDLLKNKL